jgi:hypothetical protein
MRFHLRTLMIVLALVPWLIYCAYRAPAWREALFHRDQWIVKPRYLQRHGIIGGSPFKAPINDSVE